MSDLTEIALGAGAWQVVVLPELGARFHALRYDGVDLLRTPPAVEQHKTEPGEWGSFVLAPWCNRIHRRDGEVLGRVLALESTFSDGTAIHGQVSAVEWEVVGDGAFRVSAGGDGWPWRYEVTQEVAVGESGVELRLALRNLDDSPMPAGLGIHPWYAGDVAVQVPADTVMSDNTARVAPFTPVPGELDLRSARPVVDQVDATWGDLTERVIHVSNGVVTVEHGFTAPADYVCAARKGELDATAVEPQTHAPDGLDRLRAGERGGLAVLESGEVLAVSYRWTGSPPS